ncbi:MAG: phage holin family protein [Candidatus Latescibacterota bacterium]|nr:MAG: phage holin family protein [Candidatus Latescibacterota bacterium]
MQPLNFNIRLVGSVLLRYILVWIADALSVAATAALLPGIYFVQEISYWYLSPFIVALILGLLNASVRPVLLLFLLPITFVTLGLATLVLNAALFYLAHLIVATFVIESFFAAVAGVLVLTLVNTLLGNLLRLSDDYSFYATLMDRFSAMTRPKRVELHEHGVVILQIDGLSYGTLKRALRRGKMPFVTDLLKRRKYAIRSWFCGLPSQTSSVQAGVFYGDSFDIPGFRWYDKKAGRLVVSSSSSDMSAVDERYSSYPKPLLKNGTCINSLIHGGASKRILTLSTLGEKDIKQHRGELEDFAIFSLHPYLYTRTILYMVGDFFVDRFQAFKDLFRHGKQRIRRSIKFSLLRAIANAGFREGTTHFVMEDVVRGIPVMYANYVGYDMVAHYAGPNSTDALGTLTGIDRQVRKIYRTISRKAPKHFDLIIFSDHGQSESIPFRRLFGKRLPELIGEALQKRTVERFGHTAELGYFNTLLREVRRADQAYGSRSIRRSRRTLERLHERISEGQIEDKEEEGFVVCASGNLAHVYFTQVPGRLTTEYLMKHHANLLETLVMHRGIGFLVTKRENGEILVIGKKGMRRLKSGKVEGDDPLLPYMVGEGGADTIRALTELADFPNSGDLIVNGGFVEDGAVASFEKQVGTHGGLGGAQTEPFIIFPRHHRRKRDQMRNPADLHTFLHAILAPANTSTQPVEPPSERE